MPLRDQRKNRKSKQPPQADSMDRAAEPQSPAPSRHRAVQEEVEVGWTRKQENILKERRSKCSSHKWMHYRMAHLNNKINNVLSYPLVAISAVAAAASFYTQLTPSATIDSSGELVMHVSAAAIVVMVFNALMTVVSGIVAGLKPAEKAEIHRQASLTYQAIVASIESELALKAEQREDFRFFIHDIDSKIELLSQNAPTIPWFVMKNYVMDWADEQAKDALEVDPIPMSLPVTEEPIDLMKDFEKRKQANGEQATNLQLQFEMGRTDGLDHTP